MPPDIMDPSSVLHRPSMSSITSETILPDFFHVLIIAYLGSYARTFLILQKITIFFHFRQHMGPYHNWHFKWYSFISLLNYPKLFLAFLISGSNKSTVLDFWNDLKFAIFKDFFPNILNSSLYSVCWISVIWKESHHWAKRSKSWDLGVVVTCIWVTFDLMVFKVIGSFGAFVSK